MNQKRILYCMIFTLLFAFCTPKQTEAGNPQKVMIGVGLIGGGALLTTYGFRFCLQDCGNTTVEAIAGLAMVGAGTYFVIKGAREHSLNLNAKPAEAPRKLILIGAVPIKHG